MLTSGPQCRGAILSNTKRIALHRGHERTRQAFYFLGHSDAEVARLSVQNEFYRDLSASTPRPIPPQDSRPGNCSAERPARTYEHLPSSSRSFAEPFEDMASEASAVAAEINKLRPKRGLLELLRNGFSLAGVGKIELVTFKPATGFNPAHREKYEANRFAIVRQFHFSNKRSNDSMTS
jgi:hypothetical protein